VSDVVDLSALLASRLDQDGQNGCVGAAIRTGLCATLKSLKAYAEDESWLWPWLGARFKEGTCGKNVGVYPRDAFDWLVEQGCLYDRYLHFSGQFDATPPSSQQMAEAIKYANFVYFRVGDGAQGIMESLAESQAAWQAGEPAWLVCLGGPWPDKFNNPVDGVLPDIAINDGQPSDGHEYIIYGYDKPNAKLYMCNSWGNGWGKDGTALLPFRALDVFKAWGGYDAQYITFNADPIPVPPPPEPVPVPVPNPTPVPTPTPTPTPVPVPVPGPSPVPNPTNTGCAPWAALTKLFKRNTTQFM
jgi:hypothetical protein